MLLGILNNGLAFGFAPLESILAVVHLLETRSLLYRLAQSLGKLQLHHCAVRHQSNLAAVEADVEIHASLDRAKITIWNYSLKMGIALSSSWDETA